MSNQQTTPPIRSIETPSGRISYAEAGSGPVALFVHGVVLNKHLWRYQRGHRNRCVNEIRRRGASGRFRLLAFRLRIAVRRKLPQVVRAS